MRYKSLSFRLLATEGLVLAAFFALASLALEQSFLSSAEQSLRERLQIQIYSLLSVAEMNNAGDLKMPESFHEPRFANPGSGLYGFVRGNKNKLLWRSPSAIGLDDIEPPELLPGTSEFMFDKHHRYVLHYAVMWQSVSGTERQYVFSVAEDGGYVNYQVRQLQENLEFWLIIIGLMLVGIQFALLRWSLKPLRSIVQDLEAIENGEKSYLDGQYATELEGLAGNLNAFISSERAHLERYRNNLADLAHSLKTPLAILRGCAESFVGNQETVQEQISRMNEIVEYQLQKAAAKGDHKANKALDVSLIIHKIAASLNKVYSVKNINFDLNIPEQSVAYCEQGDFYEIVGNLMDNAGKWCKQTVKVTVTLNQRRARKSYSLLLEIEDDGPGIPVEKFNEILKRGVRADENIHGHGIGMSVVYELVGLLGGQLEGGKSHALGGMRWSVYLP
ncbi:ATP-binding protein [Methylosoma difficile]